MTGAFFRPRDRCTSWQAPRNGKKALRFDTLTVCWRLAAEAEFTGHSRLNEIQDSRLKQFAVFDTRSPLRLHVYGLAISLLV